MNLCNFIAEFKIKLKFLVKTLRREPGMCIDTRGTISIFEMVINSEKQNTLPVAGLFQILRV